MGMGMGMPMPGRSMSAGTPPSTPSAAPAPEEEAGETYPITDAEISELDTNGTVTLASGCTLVKQASEDTAPASDSGDDSQSGLTA